MEVGSIGGVGHALTGTEGFEQPAEGLGTGRDQLCDRSDVVEARLVEERLVVSRWKAEAALVGGSGRVVHVEDRVRGLLLEPLANVALVGAGGGGELAGGQRSVVGQRAIEPEPVADVDREDIEGAQGRLE